MSVVGDHDEHALENCIITHTSKSIQCDLIKREPRFKLQSFPGAAEPWGGGLEGASALLLFFIKVPLARKMKCVTYMKNCLFLRKMYPDSALPNLPLHSYERSDAPDHS